MRISEAMTRDPKVASPDQTIQEVAGIMLDIDAGVMPVGENDRLVGMITDRDIAVRAIAQGKGPQTPVREVMTEDVKYCFEDEDLDEVARNMADQQVRRLPVLNRDKRLVGILSLGDMAVTQDSRTAGETLSGISEPGGEHSQGEERR
jgi:CBS domain-containing protein